MRIKQRNRELVNRLLGLEALAVAQGERREFEEVWRLLLKQQFHDIACGTLTDRALDDCYREFDLAESLIERKLAGLNRGEESAAAFNPLSFAREELIEREGRRFLVKVPPLGFVSIDETREVVAEEAGQLPCLFENEFYCARIGGDGYVESLVEKGSGRELVREEVAPFGCLGMQMDCGDLWVKFEAPLNGGSPESALTQNEPDPLDDPDPEIDVVALFIGPAGRAEWIRRIIRAGKEVMTTKPFELDPEAALAVLREARELGRVVHLNSPSPLLSPEMAKIREWIDIHDLGQPIACRADVWASYREEPDGTWYDDPEQCPVAPIFRLGIYVISDIVRFFGEPEAVQVMSSRIFTGRPTADNAQLNVLFANGAIASVFASFCVGDQEPYKNVLAMNFENGSVYRNVGPRTEADSEMAVVYVEDGEKRVERVGIDAHSGEYQWDVLYRAIREERLEREIAPEQVAAGVRIIRAMRRAELSGKMEKV